jgi:hypothetical protein
MKSMYYGYPFKCDACGKFCKREPGASVRMGYAWVSGGYEPDEEITRCKTCTAQLGPLKPHHIAKPETAYVITERA